MAVCKTACAELIGMDRESCSRQGRFKHSLTESKRGETGTWRERAIAKRQYAIYAALLLHELEFRKDQWGEVKGQRECALYGTCDSNRSAEDAYYESDDMPTRSVRSDAIMHGAAIMQMLPLSFP
jgi:hypothetical protein